MLLDPFGGACEACLNGDESLDPSTVLSEAFRDEGVLVTADKGRPKVGNRISSSLFLVEL